MLELRPTCESCQCQLRRDEPNVFICSFECTYCDACAAEHAWTCSNCGGELVRRPVPAAPFLVSAACPTTQPLVERHP